MYFTNLKRMCKNLSELIYGLIVISFQLAASDAPIKISTRATTTNCLHIAKLDADNMQGITRLAIAHIVKNASSSRSHAR